MTRVRKTTRWHERRAPGMAGCIMLGAGPPMPGTGPARPIGATPGGAAIGAPRPAARPIPGPAGAAVARRPSCVRASNVSKHGLGALHAPHLRRRRRFDRQRNDDFSAQDHEAECTARAYKRHVSRAARFHAPLLLELGLVFALGFDRAQLFAVAEHEVHVLIERKELTHKDAAILQRHPHAVVDKVDDLCPARHPDGEPNGGWPSMAHLLGWVEEEGGRKDGGWHHPALPRGWDPPSRSGGSAIISSGMVAVVCFRRRWRRCSDGESRGRGGRRA